MFIYTVGWVFIESKMALDKKCVNTRIREELQLETVCGFLRWPRVRAQIMAKFIHWGETEKDKQVSLVMVVHCNEGKCLFFLYLTCWKLSSMEPLPSLSIWLKISEKEQGLRSVLTQLTTLMPSTVRKATTIRLDQTFRTSSLVSLALRLTH